MKEDSSVMLALHVASSDAIVCYLSDDGRNPNRNHPYLPDMKHDALHSTSGRRRLIFLPVKT